MEVDIPKYMDPHLKLALMYVTNNPNSTDMWIKPEIIVWTDNFIKYISQHDIDYPLIWCSDYRIQLQIKDRCFTINDLTHMEDDFTFNITFVHDVGLPNIPNIPIKFENTLESFNECMQSIKKSFELEPDMASYALKLLAATRQVE